MTERTAGQVVVVGALIVIGATVGEGITSGWSPWDLLLVLYVYLLWWGLRALRATAGGVDEDGTLEP
ncbi:MAG: hypothetical protein IPM45_11630 [Acidimicrobiales bacterium]|nr:hypothetical protein [Acidimicrobiales bacterium]